MQVLVSTSSAVLQDKGGKHTYSCWLLGSFFTSNASQPGRADDSATEERASCSTADKGSDSWIQVRLNRTPPALVSLT